MAPDARRLKIMICSMRELQSACAAHSDIGFRSAIEAATYLLELLATQLPNKKTVTKSLARTRCSVLSTLPVCDRSQSEGRARYEYDPRAEPCRLLPPLRERPTASMCKQRKMSAFIHLEQINALIGADTLKMFPKEFSAEVANRASKYFSHVITRM